MKKIEYSLNIGLLNDLISGFHIILFADLKDLLEWYSDHDKVACVDSNSNVSGHYFPLIVGDKSNLILIETFIDERLIKISDISNLDKEKWLEEEANSRKIQILDCFKKFNINYFAIYEVVEIIEISK